MKKGEFKKLGEKRLQRVFYPPWSLNIGSLGEDRGGKAGVNPGYAEVQFGGKKIPGGVPPITATSMGQATEQKPEKPFIGFGRMMEISP